MIKKLETVLKFRIAVNIGKHFNLKIITKQ